MHQYIGLILLIIAIAAGLYLATNTEDIFKLRIGVPDIMRPIKAPPVRTGDSDKDFENGNQQVPTSEIKKTVRISSIKHPISSRSYTEVILSSNLVKGETINITGWTVKSNSGEFKIPRAQEVYSFSGTPGDINLGYRDRIHFYSLNAIKGNFRLSKCMGYLEDSSPFEPSLPKDCPRIKQSEVTDFSGACQDYLLSLHACENPSANPPILHDDSACFDFLKKLNYVGCVEKYGNDEDFLSREWRIWMENKINIFDMLHDKAQLLDKEGNVVDEYVY